MVGLSPKRPSSVPAAVCRVACGEVPTARTGCASVVSARSSPMSWGVTAVTAATPSDPQRRGNNQFTAGAVSCRCCTSRTGGTTARDCPRFLLRERADFRAWVALSRNLTLRLAAGSSISWSQLHHVDAVLTRRGENPPMAEVRRRRTSVGAACLTWASIRVTSSSPRRDASAYPWASLRCPAARSTAATTPSVPGHARFSSASASARAR